MCGERVFFVEESKLVMGQCSSSGKSESPVGRTRALRAADAANIQRVNSQTKREPPKAKPKKKSKERDPDEARRL